MDIAGRIKVLRRPKLPCELYFAQHGENQSEVYTFTRNNVFPNFHKLENRFQGILDAYRKKKRLG